MSNDHIRRMRRLTGSDDDFENQRARADERLRMELLYAELRDHQFAMDIKTNRSPARVGRDQSTLQRPASWRGKYAT